ncbi:MAG: hypothetical protein K2P93_02630 [Alphaproteobacteria bacterium]|nr:hypothetical protein [Alphaproteobacteria bacterium]
MRTTNGHGSMNGSAFFRPISASLPSFLYREDGFFYTAYGDKLAFYQEYLYCLNQEHIEVYFVSREKKKRFFHSFTFLSFQATNSTPAIHQCGKDKYIATYTFLNKDTFTLQYSVHGPQKKFILTTRFERKKPNELLSLYASDSNKCRQRE